MRVIVLKISKNDRLFTCGILYLKNADLGWGGLFGGGCSLLRAGITNGVGQSFK